MYSLLCSGRYNFDHKEVIAVQAGQLEKPVTVRTVALADSPSFSRDTLPPLFAVVVITPRGIDGVGDSVQG